MTRTRLIMAGVVSLALGVTTPSFAQSAAAPQAGASAGAASGAAPNGSKAKPPSKLPSPNGPTAAAGGDQVMRYPPSSVRVGLITGGTAIFGAAYGLGVMTSQIWKEVPGSESMLIPVAGPWMSLAQNECSPDSPDCGAILFIRGALLVLDGIAQLGALALIGEGLFMTTEADGAPPSKAPPGKAAPKKAAWSLAPVVTPNQTGLSVVGSF